MRDERALDRTSFLRLGALAAGVGLVAGCGGAQQATGSEDAAGTAASETPQPAAAPEPPPLEDEPGNLLVFDWAGYEVKPLWREYRERFPDQRPKFQFLTSDDQALGKVQTGYHPDLIHPCVGYVKDWVSLGAVQPFDTSLLTHFGQLNPALVQAGQVDGRQYFIPADWGFSAPMYRADKVDPKEDSWNLLYDERYAGKISWWDSMENLIIAGYVRGFANPWDMTDDELEVAKKDLIGKRHLVRNFWSSYVDLNADIAAGNVWIAYAWPDAWVTAKGQGVDVVYGNPNEGRLSWVCGFVLGEGTKNYRHAHAFVDAWISPETALWTLENYAYGHANTVVDLSKIDPALVKAFNLEDPNVLAEPRTHIDRWIPRRRLYNRIWDEVKAA